MQVKVKKLNSEAKIPTYGRKGDACLDLCALDSHLLDLGDIETVKTGIAMEIPEGYEGVVRGRSGLSSKGINVAIGTIDSNYRGDISVVISNYSTEMYRILAGDRIAQLAIRKTTDVELVEVNSLSNTVRGTQGFGSSGN